MKKIIILGVSGSIGQTALDVVRCYPDNLQIVGLHAHSNYPSLEATLAEFKPSATALSNPALAKYSSITYQGPTAIENLIKNTEADLVLNAIAGSAGLQSSFWALESGKDLALANKESLVMAGPLLRATAQKHQQLILPVDSEHSAIFFLLQNRAKQELAEIILTASGGPFRNYSTADLSTITVEQAANHPTWKMGQKISIDSATLANKGLEVIEAWRLFDIELENIKVLVHPQSLVHSLIRTTDGALYAQISATSMALPIQNALLYPLLKPVQTSFLDLVGHNLQFEAINHAHFPLLNLAYVACKQGDPYPIAYNAANELAVEQFCKKKIVFSKIYEYTERALNFANLAPANTVAEILALDAEIKRLLLEE